MKLQKQLSERDSRSQLNALKNKETEAMNESERKARIKSAKNASVSYLKLWIIDLKQEIRDREYLIKEYEKILKDKEECKS